MGKECVQDATSANRRFRLAVGSMRRTVSSGFTLIELIVVIVILGALSTVAAQLIRQPFEANAALQRRARLADDADQAMARISRDLRLALPNSIRVSGDGRAIDLLLTDDGGRYRAELTALGTGDLLAFDLTDNSFDVLGGLSAAPAAGQFIVIYNLTQTGAAANAWWSGSGGNRALVGSGSSTTSVTLSPAFKFPFRSPSQRFFLVGAAVMYRCEGDLSLRRYTGYAIADSQPGATPTPGSSALVTGGVGSCSFRYAAGASSRHALVSLSITLTRDNETASMLKTVHVPNSP